jgi:hypothetical protein
LAPRTPLRKLRTTRTRTSCPPRTWSSLYLPYGRCTCVSKSLTRTSTRASLFGCAACRFSYVDVRAASVHALVAVGVEERRGVRVASSEDGRGTIFSAWQIASRWLRSAFLFFLHGRYAHGTHSLGASLSEQISACWLEWSVIHLPIIGQTDRSVCDLIDIPTFLANGQCEVSTYVSPTNLPLWFMKAISNETCRNLWGNFVVAVYESNQQ